MTGRLIAAALALLLPVAALAQDTIDLMNVGKVAAYEVHAIR